MPHFFLEKVMGLLGAFKKTLFLNGQNDQVYE